jgi:phosphate starvation-inducible protein PhoH and related proteins
MFPSPKTHPTPNTGIQIMAKTNRQKPTRREKEEQGYRGTTPLEPMTQGQSEYMQMIRTSPITFATGYPGTSKTYIPTRMASTWLKQGAIEKIILMRPAVSASQSIGFAKGTHEEKMRHWLRPILGALQEEFSYGQLGYLMKEEIQKIDFCPLENVKGNSWKNAFIIVDEAEDCTLAELKSIVTRLGTNSTLVLCGDIAQCDLQATSGLKQFLSYREKNSRLQNAVAWMDFNEFDDIVRSEICKEIVKGFAELGLIA